MGGRVEKKMEEMGEKKRGGGESREERRGRNVREWMEERGCGGVDGGEGM